MLRNPKSEIRQSSTKLAETETELGEPRAGLQKPERSFKTGSLRSKRARSYMRHVIVHCVRNVPGRTCAALSRLAGPWDSDAHATINRD